MRKLLLATALSVAVLAGCSKSDPAGTTATNTDDLPIMTVDELSTALAAKQAQAIDCNGDGTRKKKGVVPGAILISDEEAFAASELPSDKTTKLVFYCSGPG